MAIQIKRNITIAYTGLDGSPLTLDSPRPKSFYCGEATVRAPRVSAPVARGSAVKITC